MHRLYCHVCGRVTEQVVTSQSSLQCIQCDRQQSVNSMVTRKNPLTNPDGTQKTKRNAKGGLTGSKRFQTPDISLEEPVQSLASNVSSGDSININRSTNSGASSGVLGTASGIDPTVRRSFDSGQSHAEALSKANSLASQYGIQEIDIGSLLGGDPYTADGAIPQLSASDANHQKLILQRQSNAVEVRHEKIKLGRKVVKMASEQVGLIGDLVDYATAGVDTATKVVKNEIAEVKFFTENSKLVQTEELFTQQQIATAGTIALTEGIREEWNLKLEKQFTRNSGLKIEVEGSIQENERKRQELESKLLSA